MVRQGIDIAIVLGFFAQKDNNLEIGVMNKKIELLEHNYSGFNDYLDSLKSEKNELMNDSTNNECIK